MTKASTWIKYKVTRFARNDKGLGGRGEKYKISRCARNLQMKRIFCVKIEENNWVNYLRAKKFESRRYFEMGDKTYYVYITTNPGKTTLYIGVTNNLSVRIKEHWRNRGKPETFAGKYFCYHLVFYETYAYINQAISRETEIKKWTRLKKEELITSRNPTRRFLNIEICGHWPPNN